ncbi:MAG: L-rhamnose mutarotase [Bacteroidetes bacterium]|nr:L-rhamnose mutarotase [Bacteroidota bacterium]
MRRYCLALDLKDDADKIHAYKYHHKNVWPEINQSLIDAGIDQAEIFNTGNRLFMILEVNESFTFDRKSMMDAQNPKVQEWEALMDTFQQELPKTKKGTKWVLMDKIYSLKKEKYEIRN